MFNQSGRIRRTHVAAVLGATFLMASCGISAAPEMTDTGADDTDSLVFAVVPSENAATIAEDYDLVVEVLEQELARDIEVHHLTSYAAMIEAQHAGQVDIGVYGPFSYISAVDSGVELSAVAAAATSPTDSATYRSLGVVGADSGVENLAELAGREVCFVDQTSTSGYLYPAAGLISAGVDPHTDVTPFFVGGHDAVAISVADGTCAGGFIHDTLLERLLSEGTLTATDVDVIWHSADIAPTPVVVHDRLGAELTARIKEVFTTQINQDALVDAGFCGSPADCRLPQDAWGYLPVDDSVYDSTREVCELTAAEACSN